MGAKDLFRSIITMPLEEVMSDRFGRYSKYIIQERALPDARDGLKPVQRRIIYSMNKEGNTFTNQHRKSAKTVGNVIGNYHPHGDSSVYDAMVRMSQWWKLRYPLVDMHGNNGSIDNDPAAAMRYTEARMSKMSALLVEDINKETIKWTLNFDDTELEPSVFPAKYPNLLVNGAKGIASGYATDIPPHNLNEIIEATIRRIDSPNCRLDSIMDIVKGPDFPTGGIVMGRDGVRKAFETGKGKVIVRAKTTLPTKKNDWKILIHEIPYEVVKSNIVREIAEIQVSGEISGIAEVRDETDRNGMQIAVDLKPGTDAELVLNYLFKQTQLQVSYNYNMVAIVDKRPLQLGILELLDAYIAHQREILVRRSKFNLKKSETRARIVNGLILAINNIDQVIRLIREATGKADAKDKIIKALNFTEEQAEAIVILRLYRLSSTDVTELETESGKLADEINLLKELLEKPELIDKEIKDKLRTIKKNFDSKRLSVMVDEIVEIKIDKEALIDAEDVYISVSKDGYIKRSSNRSYQAASATVPETKDEDYVVSITEANTVDKLIVITSLGKYAFIPVFTIPEKPWKNHGEHISTICKLSGNDKVVSVITVKEFSDNYTIVMASKNGMIKRTLLTDFEVQRYSRALTCMKLKEGDKLISAHLSEGNGNVLMISELGYINKYLESTISITGIKSAGVKAITLRDDVAKCMLIANDNEAFLYTTNKGQGKRIWVKDIPNNLRTTKGVRVNKDVKSNPQLINYAHIVEANTTVNCHTNRGDKKITAKDIQLSGIDSGNSTVFDKTVTIEKSITNVAYITGKPKPKKETPKPEVKAPVEIKKEKVEQEQLSLDDFVL